MIERKPHRNRLIKVSAGFRQRLAGWAGRLTQPGRRSPGHPELEISITRLPEWSLLTVRGRVNAAATDCFRRSLEQTFGFSGRPVVVDLRDAEFDEAAAVRSLADSWEDAIRRGVPVEVVLNVAGVD